MQCCCIDEVRFHNSIYGYSSNNFVSSSACSCFSPPLQIFRVCRQLSAEASEVFFAQNRFILHSNPEGCLHFLRSQGHDRLRRIRLLELCFEGDDLWSLGRFLDAAQLEWEQLITFVSENFTLSNLFLTLRIEVNENAVLNPWTQGYRPELTTDQHALLYEILSRSLSRLRGAYRFFAILGWFHQYETRLERHVMGDDYDSSKHGKLAYSDRDPWDHYRRKLVRN